MKRGHVEVPVRVIRETDKAMLCALASREEILERQGQANMFPRTGPPAPRPQCWIPKSQIDTDLSTAACVGDEGVLVIPEWLYDAKMEEVALAYGAPEVHARSLEDVIEERKQKGGKR